MLVCRGLFDGKRMKTPKGGKKKNEFLLGSGRHTLLQTLVGELACSGLQMCVTAAWHYVYFLVFVLNCSIESL
ncbi:MAG: hypothetical protein EAY75_09505 [Bacteroidetes bacterium]|nr:MAG: hypothetical protein EAY75_09505 [Bacteroidota bacterium]